LKIVGDIAKKVQARSNARARAHNP